MREAGVEPARPCEHWHLKPASLPIPPLAQVGVFGAITSEQGVSYHEEKPLSTSFFNIFPLTNQTESRIMTKLSIEFADVLELVDWLA